MARKRHLGLSTFQNRCALAVGLLLVSIVRLIAGTEISPTLSSSSIAPSTSYSSSLSPVVAPTPLATTEQPTTVATTPITTQDPSVANVACESSPCQNGGTCSPSGTASYTCACANGYEGLNCQTRTSSFRASTTFVSIVIAGNRFTSFPPLLADTTSTLYRQACEALTTVITRSLQLIYGGTNILLNVVCLGFSSGSIVGNYVVEVKATENDALSDIPQQIERKFKENNHIMNTSTTSWIMRENSTTVEDFDECSKQLEGYCDASATCVNTITSYQCTCPSDHVLTAAGKCFKSEETDNTVLYIIFGVIGGLLLLLILLMGVLLRRKSKKRLKYTPKKPAASFYGEVAVSPYGRNPIGTMYLPEERLRARVRTLDDMEWDPSYPSLQK